jgi:LytS/YehU family sensor histidine kinase
MARLSDIMRYFMEESPKEQVPIATELELVEDFIRLEQVRFHFPIEVDIDKAIRMDLMVPPMLLLPLVENVFKHGIKFDAQGSSIEIRLRHQDNHLTFTTKNKCYKKLLETGRDGVGLKNLRERLTLLYQNNYCLQAQEVNGNFVAELTIPAHEN